MTKLEKACEAITNYVQKYHGEDDLMLDRATYQLVGQNYPYTGYVLDARGDVYGFWKDGIYYDFRDLTSVTDTSVNSPL